MIVTLVEAGFWIEQAKESFLIKVPEGFIVDYLPTDPRFLADFMKSSLLDLGIDVNSVSLRFKMPEELSISTTFLAPDMEKKYLEQESILELQRKEQIEPWEYVFDCYVKNKSQGIVEVYGTAYNKQHVDLYTDLFSLIGKKNKVMLTKGIA